MKKKGLFCMIIILLVVVSSAAADKVVVVPLNSSGPTTRLWGEGRVGTSATVETTANGVNIARSAGLASWDGAAAACPKNTWVCTESDVMNLSITAYTSLEPALGCGGAPGGQLQTWVQDEASDYQGRTAYVSLDQIIVQESYPKCNYFRVWCCSNAN